MTDVTLLAGAAIFLAGMVTGRAWPSRRRKFKPVEPLCGCHHHHSFHDPQTEACHGTIARPQYGVTGAYLGTRDVACTCRKYTGPEPLPEYYAPEIGSSA